MALRLRVESFSGTNEPVTWRPMPVEVLLVATAAWW